MDMYEMINQQLVANPQFAAQIFQLMQQNGMIPPNSGNPNNGGYQQPQQMNWNQPTNPMAAMMYTYMNMMNNQNNTQPTQNQAQSSDMSIQSKDNKISFARTISSPDEIRVDEIPTNGGIGLFLQEDAGIIYGKRWTNNGVVENTCYVLEKDDQKISENSNNSSIDIDVLFKKISEMVDEKISHLNLPDKSGKKGVEKNGA